MQFAHAEPARIVRVVTGRERAAGDSGGVVPDDQDPAARLGPVHGAHERARSHRETGFLAHLAHQRLLVGLARLDPAPRQRPAARLRLVAPLDEQDQVPVGDDGADTRDAQLSHGPSIQ